MPFRPPDAPTASIVGRRCPTSHSNLSASVAQPLALGAEAPAREGVQGAGVGGEGGSGGRHGDGDAGPAATARGSGAAARLRTLEARGPASRPAGPGNTRGPRRPAGPSARPAPQPGVLLRPGVCGPSAVWEVSTQSGQRASGTSFHPPVRGGWRSIAFIVD